MLLYASLRVRPIPRCRNAARVPRAAGIHGAMMHRGGLMSQATAVSSGDQMLLQVASIPNTTMDYGYLAVAVALAPFLYDRRAVLGERAKGRKG